MVSLGNGQSGSSRGLSPKTISLLTLTLQNAAFSLLMHYSRVMPIDGYRYLPSTAVLLNEILKLGISAVMTIRDLPKDTYGGKTPSVSTLMRSIFSRDIWKLAVPAVLYTLQNSLQYIAGSNLDAATFQVLYQLRILTTACFSAAFLGKKIAIQQWGALLLLTIGVGLVQVTPESGSSAMKTLRMLFQTGGFGDRMLAAQVLSHSKGRPPMNRTVGFLAVFIACTTSGAAGVYFEKVLKTTSSSVWVRNVQLSGFSIVPALLIGVMYNDGQKISERGFFAGYNIFVWMLIVIQATSGIVVALVIKYADNVAKNFATSISILLCAVVSVLFFHLQMTWNFVLGAALVMYATYWYSEVGTKLSRPVEKRTKGSFV